MEHEQGFWKIDIVKVNEKESPILVAQMSFPESICSRSPIY